MNFIGGIGCAAVVLTLCLGPGGSEVRARDACLLVAGLGVLLTPVADFVLSFFGFVFKPLRYVGDYWTMQRDARLEAIIVAMVIAVLIVGAGAVGGTSRPRSRWRLSVGLVEVIAGFVFAGLELSVNLPYLADASSRIGTFPM